MYRYIFDGVNVKLAGKKTKNEELIYDTEDLKIMLIRQEKTMEASSADWKLFKEYFVDVPNDKNFLKSKMMPVSEANSLIMGDKKVVAYTDLKRTFEHHATRWSEDQNTTKEHVITEVYKVMIMLEEVSFNLDHELPLNKRFVKQFKETMEGKGFVVAETLPHDNVSFW